MNDTLELEPAADTAPALELMPRADNLAIWGEFKIKAEALKLTAETLNVTSIEDLAGQKIARTTRLSLREIRIAVEKRRVEMVEDMTKETKRINSAAKAVKDFIEPLEKRLQAHEDFIEIETARLRHERNVARYEEIKPFIPSNSWGDVIRNYGDMTDEQWLQCLSDAKDLHALKLKREADAEAARVAQQKAEADERERIRLENVRLKEEAAAREAAAKVERDAAAKRQREIEERAAAERKAAADKAEKERLAIEAERRKEREAAAEGQRIADALVQEARRQLDLERADADRVKEEARTAEIARAKAAREAAAAPDREKLNAFAHVLATLPVPTVSEAAGHIIDSIIARLGLFSRQIREAAEKL